MLGSIACKIGRMRQLFLAMTLLFLLSCGSAVEESVEVSQVTDALPTVTHLLATDIPPTMTAPPEATSIPTDVIVPTDVPPTETVIAVTDVPTLEPTATVIATEEPVAMLGRTTEGALYMGRANADIKLIDYSDFL